MGKIWPKEPPVVAFLSPPLWSERPSLRPDVELSFSISSKRDHLLPSLRPLHRGAFIAAARSGRAGCVGNVNCQTDVGTGAAAFVPITLVVFDMVL